MKIGRFSNKVRFNYLLIFLGLITISLFILESDWKARKFLKLAYQQVFINPLAIVNGNDELQTIKECDCQRKYFYQRSTKHVKILNSSCSDEGSFYEPGQKVVSISMSFPDPAKSEMMLLYKKGIIKNLKRIKKYYPNTTTMRLYTDVNLEPGSSFCRLLCEHPELHWCDVRRTPSLGNLSDMFLMTWRFLPLGDPSVDYFLSRDLDSVIIERQVGAVKEWLANSSKPFHLMRDHKDHNGPILGGLWGARNPLLGLEEAAALRDKIIFKAKRCSKRKQDDQIILRDIIFYPEKRKILAFDSYFCRSGLGKSTEVRPFPVKRKDKHYDFAGNCNLGRARYDLAKCPMECRPEYGKDWEYC